MYSWLNRRASRSARVMTSRAPSVNRGIMTSISSAMTVNPAGGDLHRCTVKASRGATGSDGQQVVDVSADQARVLVPGILPVPVDLPARTGQGMPVGGD